MRQRLLARVLYAQMVKMKDNKEYRTGTAEQHIKLRLKEKAAPLNPTIPTSILRTPKKKVSRPNPDRRIIQLFATDRFGTREGTTTPLTTLTRRGYMWRKGEDFQFRILSLSKVWPFVYKLMQAETEDERRKVDRGWLRYEFEGQVGGQIETYQVHDDETFASANLMHDKVKYIVNVNARELVQTRKRDDKTFWINIHVHAQ